MFSLWWCHSLLFQSLRKHTPVTGFSTSRWVRQLQAILKIRKKKKPPQFWFCLKWSCNPIIPMSSKNTFSKRKQGYYWWCLWLLSQWCIRWEVWLSIRGRSKMHLHHLPLVFSKVLPLMPTVISGLRMKRLCCFPLIQRNCHNLRSTGHR